VKVSLDRPICKFVGKGDDEFLHLDKCRFSEPILDMISGKYSVGQGSFVCVPESHKWNAAIKQLYEPHYTGGGGQKWGLDPAKPDPLNLYEKARKVIIPAGAMLFWLQDTVHGVVKNKTDHIAWGLYVGYSTDVERAKYTKVHKVEEVLDRVRVFKKGVSPKGFPSIDTVHTYPLRFKNFHRNIGNFVEKMDQASSKQYGFAKRKLDNRDEFVPHLVEYDPVDYEPPRLSKRGKELLVGKKRVHEFFRSDDADGDDTQVGGGGRCDECD
jgi:hypothetical protein